MTSTVPIPVPPGAVTVPATTVTVPATTVNITVPDGGPIDAAYRAAGWAPTVTPTPTSRLRGVWTSDKMTLADIEHFEAATGKTMNCVLAFTDGSTWSSIRSSPAGWAKYWAPSGLQLILTYPLLPGTGYAPSHNQVGFAEIVAGAHDADYTASLTSLAALAPTTILRIGHEFNLGEAPWAAGDGKGGLQPGYVLAVQHVVRLAKAIPGNHFTFATFNPSNGDPQNTGDPTAGYPGDALCDFVGPDVYCTSPPSGTGGGFLGEPAAWNRIQTGLYGLNWHIAFARAHAKPLLIPEWGLWKPAAPNAWPQGGGDDPTFMAGMCAAITANGIGASLWTDDYDLLGAPLSLAVYRAEG